MQGRRKHLWKVPSRKARAAKQLGDTWDIYCSGLRFPVHCPCLGQVQTPQTSWDSPTEPEIWGKRERAVACSVISKKAIKPFEIICIMAVHLHNIPNCWGQPAFRLVLGQVDSASHWLFSTSFSSQFDLSKCIFPDDFVLHRG